MQIETAQMIHSGVFRRQTTMQWPNENLLYTGRYYTKSHAICKVGTKEFVKYEYYA